MTSDHQPSPEDALGQAFRQFCSTIEKLRDPKDGCPWDLKQTHVSLKKHLLEECYEASEAMMAFPLDDRHLCEELGDVLLQVVLHAQIASERNAFSITDIIEGVNKKIIFRHPHVFGSTAEKQKAAGEIKQSFEDFWQARKKEEKKTEDQTTSFLQDSKWKHLPSTMQAAKIGEKVSEVQFDWDSVLEAFGKVKEEMTEVENELTKTSLQKSKVEEEIGDLYFSLAQLCRHLDIDPESTAQKGNIKFVQRFKALEKEASLSKIDIKKTTREVLESLWHKIKK